MNDDQSVNWANIDDYGSLPPSGTITLVATLLLNGTTPVYNSTLMLGMECTSINNSQTLKREITVPVKFTSG